MEQLNKSRINEFVQNISVEPAQIYEKISEYLTRGLNAVTDSISNAVSVVTNVVIVITTIPLLLYYLLKEDKRAYTAFLMATPKRYREEMKDTLKEIDHVLSGFIKSPMMALWVLIIVVLANQIEGNLLSPHIYGRSLNIHPFTTILLLWVSGTIRGIIGILIVIPAYLIIKIIITKVISHHVTPET